MARDDWLSRSPRRGERRWGDRRAARERARELEELERGYGGAYQQEGWESEEGGFGPARARRASERWGADWWGAGPRGGFGGGYGGYEQGYGEERMARRRGEGWRRGARPMGRRYRGEEVYGAYGSPYYDRLPFRSRRRGEGGGEMGYGWAERRVFRPYDREFQGGYGEMYRGGYTGEYGWGGRPGYRPWRGVGRGGMRRRGRYDREYGW